jgi:hypothetical protein
METTMGEALPPSFQEIVARCIINKPNAPWLIDWIKADHQEQRRKLKNRIAPLIPRTSEWLDLSTRNKPATSQWTKSIAWITPTTKPTEEITRYINPYSVLKISKMEDNDEQTTNAPGTQQTTHGTRNGQNSLTINTIISKLQRKKKEARANDPRIKIQSLRMKGLQLTQYIKEFEQLAEQAGLISANPATTQAFVKGLTPSMQKDLTSTRISRYRMARAAAIKANQVDKLLTALIAKTQPHKWSLEERMMDEPPAKEQKVLTTDAPTFWWAWKAAQWLVRTYTPGRTTTQETT